MRTVFTRAVKTIDVATPLRLVVSLFDFAFYRMRSRAWAGEEEVALPGAEAHHLYGEAAGVAGYLAWQRGTADEAVRLTEVALARVSGQATWGRFDSLGTIELFRGRVERVHSRHERA